MKKKIAILGSTGSIGKFTLDVIRKDKKNFEVVFLSANNNYKKLIKLGFEKEDTKKLHKYWDEIIDKQQWSEGYFTQTFEEKWSEYNNLESVAFSSWGGAALAALEFFNIKEKTVLCPSNTFMATPLAAIKAGNRVEFVDCNKDDLCLSYEVLKEKNN